MIAQGYISEWSKLVKNLTLCFVVTLTIGYFSALLLVNNTTDMQAASIVEQFTGNEDKPDAEIMKFKKSSYEILNILHTHVLSLSMIFFLTGGLVLRTHLSSIMKQVLCFEPFISIILTFGGIYLIWTGMPWVHWVVMVSGLLMTISFIISTGAIVFDCIR